MTDSTVSLLLDDLPLEGTVGVTRLLGPPQYVVAVADGATSAAEAVQTRCELWGGAVYLLVPADGENLPATGLWADLVRRSMSDKYVGVGVAQKNLPKGIRHTFALAESIAVVLASLDREPTELRPVSIPELSVDDPWWIAYQADYWDAA